MLVCLWSLFFLDFLGLSFGHFEVFWSVDLERVCPSAREGRLMCSGRARPQVFPWSLGDVGASYLIDLCGGCWFLPIRYGKVIWAKISGRGMDIWKIYSKCFEKCSEASLDVFYGLCFCPLKDFVRTSGS